MKPLIVPPIRCGFRPLLLSLLAGAFFSSFAFAADSPSTAKQEKEKAAAAPAPAKISAAPVTNVLVFRNERSWRRKIDFEEALTNLGLEFDVKPPTEMTNANLSAYGMVIIPGGQWRDGFYLTYSESAERFDRYVTNGGILVLELNGAERDGITLPRGVQMIEHGSTDNILLVPDHPILLPLEGKPIHANFASHGYLEEVPKDALVLVAEMEESKAVLDKPTFIEYPCGSGRVLAACQCFHDQDRSGRGPLMETLISYAAEREWFSRKK